MPFLPFERSYLVIPNKLIAGEIMASKNEADTIKKLDGLVAANVKVVINLMESTERNRNDNYFYDYSSYLNQHGIETHRHL